MAASETIEPDEPPTPATVAKLVLMDDGRVLIEYLYSNFQVIDVAESDAVTRAAQKALDGWEPPL